MTQEPSLREKKNQAVKQALFDAAIELFKEKGFDGTSVDEIAERAGYSRATYFNHFGTKQGVLRFYGQRLQDRVETSLAEIEPTASPLERIRGLLFTMAREADSHSEALKLVYLYSRSDTEYLTKPTSARKRVFELLESLVRQAQKAEEVRIDLTSEMLAYHILAIYQGAVWASVGGYCKAEPALETGWAFILNGVRGGSALAE